MSTKYLFRTFLISASALTLLPAFTNAAGLDLIQITTVPATYGPGEEVTVKLQSYSVNLSSARILWAVDGEPIKEGIAERTFTLTAGEIGVAKTVDIVIDSPSGRFDKQIVIAPVEIDLLWEAQTYVPPLYKGKALATHDSPVKVVAFPRFNTGASDPSAFFYRWSTGVATRLGEALAKNYTVIRAGWKDSTQKITVEVTDPSTDIKGRGVLNIPSDAPRVVFYKHSPLSGTDFSTAAQPSVSSESDIGIELRAEPYFFTRSNVNDFDILYTWTIGRKTATPKSDQRHLEIARADGRTQTVGIQIQNPKHVTQSASGQTTVSFTPITQ